MGKGGLIFLGCLGAAAILLPFVLRRRETAAYQLVPVRRALPQPQTLTPASEYSNEETWNLDYDEEGRVKRVVVKRRAVQT